ncbi:type II toxin-antitoxin system RelE/ParE family toxin [Schinkia azotoformans]|uniref:type II toxin-antitoxin system RelE/ParE family toxin n=1 Tax=Schinkia azotoformans TaxID=1454 RepID=UPI002E227BA0|nr:type II toxin-antitoxin system RelE/ParE family toxin [Schinkia azotoformans]
MIKKLSKKQPVLVQEFDNKKAILLESPTSGKPLKGDLQGYYSYDWTLKGISLRIAYLYDDNESHIYFLYYGTRENFYEDLKRYIN